MSQEEPNPFAPPEAEIPAVERPKINLLQFYRDLVLHPARAARSFLDYPMARWRLYAAGVANGLAITMAVLRPELPRAIQWVTAAGIGFFVWSILGVLWLLVMSHWQYRLGKAFGGTGTRDQLFRVTALAYIPAPLEALVRVGEFDGWFPWSVAQLCIWTLAALGVWIGTMAALEAHQLKGDSRVKVMLIFLALWLFIDGQLFHYLGGHLNDGIRWISFMFFPYG